MNSSRRKLAAILEALGVPPSARRPAAAPAAPACEPLEGRQLLAGGLGMAAMDLPAMGYGAAGPADFATHSGGLITSDSMGPQGFPGGPMNRDFAKVHLDGQASTSSDSSGAIGVSSMVLGGKANISAVGGGFGKGYSTMPFDQLDGQGSMVPGQASGSTADATQLRADTEKLRTDSQAIHDKSQVTPAMEAKVRNDIKAIKEAETTTPDQAAETTLQADLKAARANAGGPTDAQVAQIQADQDAIYKSQGVNAALVGQLDADIQAIKTASGVTADDEATLAADRKAIEADFAKLTPPTTATATPSTAPPLAVSSDSTATATPIDSSSTPATTLVAATSTTTAASPPTSPTSAPMSPTPAPTSPTTPPGAVMQVMHARPGHHGHFASFGHSSRGRRG